MKLGLTEQAKNLRMKTSKTVVEQFEKQYSHSLAACEALGHSLAYKAALQYINETEKASSEPISCRAGCGACCHQPVFASFDEFEAIKDHLVETGRKLDRNKLQMQKEDLVDGVFTKLKVPDRKCVFLGANNSCTIYEVRPLLCRRYNVYSNPAHCASGSTSQIKYDVNARTEGHLSAYFTFFGGNWMQEHLLNVPEILEDGVQ